MRAERGSWTRRWRRQRWEELWKRRSRRRWCDCLMNWKLFAKKEEKEQQQEQQKEREQEKKNIKNSNHKNKNNKIKYQRSARIRTRENKKRSSTTTTRTRTSRDSSRIANKRRRWLWWTGNSRSFSEIAHGACRIVVWPRAVLYGDVLAVPFIHRPLSFSDKMDCKNRYANISSARH